LLLSDGISNAVNKEYLAWAFNLAVVDDGCLDG